MVCTILHCKLAIRWNVHMWTRYWAIYSQQNLFTDIIWSLNKSYEVACIEISIPSWQTEIHIGAIILEYPNKHHYMCRHRRCMTLINMPDGTEYQMILYIYIIRSGCPISSYSVIEGSLYNWFLVFNVWWICVLQGNGYFLVTEVMVWLIPQILLYCETGT